jgi:hypothetical protein
MNSSIIKKVFVAAVTLAALAGVSTACDSLDSASKDHPFSAEGNGPQSKKDKPAGQDAGDTDGVSMTKSQEQAVGSAQDYLEFSGFSKAGLIDQLSSKAGDGFTKADATFAVNHITVNWNEQAVRSAKDYLSFSHFSRAGLIEQLSSKAGDGYTKAQATYAAGHVGL